MKLKELLMKYTEEEIAGLVEKKDPGSRVHYLRAIKIMKLLEPLESAMRLYINQGSSEDEAWLEVSGRDGTPSEHNENEEEEYALELTAWEKWLGMEISGDTLKKYSESVILVECLAEMTYNGFSPTETEDERQKLLAIFAEAEKEME